MDLNMQTFDEKMIHTLVAIEQYIIAFFWYHVPQRNNSAVKDPIEKWDIAWSSKSKISKKKYANQFFIRILDMKILWKIDNQ